jgi:hypothetical protein
MRFCWIPALCLLLGPVAHAADPAIVINEFIFTEKPTPGCHASTIAEHCVKGQSLCATATIDYMDNRTAG